MGQRVRSHSVPISERMRASLASYHCLGEAAAYSLRIIVVRTICLAVVRISNGPLIGYIRETYHIARTQRRGGYSTLPLHDALNESSIMWVDGTE